MNVILAAAYLGGTALFILGGAGIPLSAAVFTLATVFLVEEFAFLSRLFDPFFKRRPGANVVGIQEPASDVRQQIVLCSHHDSTPICNFLEKRQGAYAFRIVIPMIFHAVANIGALLAAIGWMPGSMDGGRRPIFMAVLIAGCLFAIPLFWFYGRDASPGASDNLVSSLLLVKLAELFKSGDLGPLEHTRLVFLSADGEENGQRGSFEYARKHRAELLGTITCVFTMDTLSRLEDLALLKTDLNGFVRLSAPLTGECSKIAAELGLPVRTVRFPFGGGGTDAGQFARIGVVSASLIGITTRFIRKGIAYHTSRDTVDNLEPAAVEGGLNIAANLILAKDKAVM